MLSLSIFFFVSFFSFAKNLFFLGFCLLFLSCFLVFFLWNFFSQWISLIIFLVFITGVVVMFIFFCSFSSKVGGLIFFPLFPIVFFGFFGLLNLSFFFFDKKTVSHSSEFYFLSELSFIFFLGMWLMFVLWGSLKILNFQGGMIRG